MSDFLRALVVYIPISVIGLWRWSYWALRVGTAKMYKSPAKPWPKSKTRPSVAVVTPVYNEDPELFEVALQSWIRNGVDEIVAVIDKSNKRHIVSFERNYVPRKDVKCRLLVTPKPGKRAALCDGIVYAKSDIITLVDSDTVWEDGVANHAMGHFKNPNIGGVTVKQRILNPKGTSDVLFDLLLWTRYREEVPFLLVLGKVVNTLSGRTAFYRREAIFNKKFDNMHLLRHEFFLKTRGVSGDDKRLTHLILEQGWHIGYVGESAVLTPGLGNMKKFMKQRLRWTRNSWRADLRAVKRRWVFGHPTLSYFMIDRFIQPFIMMLGPIACFIAVRAEDWLAVAILVSWWFFSRFVRTYSYWREYPARIRYIPAYIIYGYVNALIKIYALVTTVEHSWATRWDKQRLQKGKRRLRRMTPIIVGTAGIFLFMLLPINFVRRVNEKSGAQIPVPASVSIQEFQDTVSFESDAKLLPTLPESAVLPTGVKEYIVAPGDTLNEIATITGMDIKTLKKLNGLRDADKITTGQRILYYQAGGL